MDYEKQITSILYEAGPKGLPVSKIARHVHNEVNSLFERVEFDAVYADVRRFIYRNSRNPHSLFEHAQHWGYYRLNTSSERYRELFVYPRIF